MCGIKSDQSSAMDAGYSVMSVCPYFEILLNLPTYFLMMHHSILLPFKPGSSKLFTFSCSPLKLCMHSTSVLLSDTLPPPSVCNLFYYPNNI